MEQVLSDHRGRGPEWGVGSGVGGRAANARVSGPGLPTGAVSKGDKEGALRGGGQAGRPHQHVSYRETLGGGSDILVGRGAQGRNQGRQGGLGRGRGDAATRPWGSQQLP